MKETDIFYRLKLSYFLLYSIILLLPNITQGQEIGDTITGKVHKITDVIVTAERTKQQVKSI